MAISRSQTVELALSLADAFEQCLKAREAVPHSSLRDFDQSSGTITFGVRMSLKSWGERVTLQLRETGAASTAIEVTSRASSPLTFADYGKNAKNVQQVVDWLAALPGAHGAGQSPAALA